MDFDTNEYKEKKLKYLISWANGRNFYIEIAIIFPYSEKNNSHFEEEKTFQWTYWGSLKYMISTLEFMVWFLGRKKNINKYFDMYIPNKNNISFNYIRTMCIF